MRLGKGGGAVSVIREIGSPFGRVARQEGIFEHNSGKPLWHASFSRCVMTGCIHPMSNQGLDRDDHSQKKD
jgi:hypothetical protein